MANFEGKLAIVTGAAHGMGKSITESLIAKGCLVIAVDKDTKLLAELKESIVKSDLLSPLPLDITDWQATRSALSSAIAGRDVHFLVNCAAVISMMPFEYFDENTIDKHYTVNFKAIVNISQVVVERMKASGKGGSIVHISSNGSVSPYPYVSIYCALKAALDHLTHCMARELGPYKIRVNTVNPGPVNTGFGAPSALATKDAAEGLKQMVKKQALDLNIEPRDIAEAVMFLLSGDSSAAITGQNLRVDAGITLG